MQSSPPDHTLLLYIWSPESRREQLRAPVGDFLSFLHQYRNRISVVLSDEMKDLFSAELAQLSVISPDSATELLHPQKNHADKNYTLYPIIACNLRSFEKGSEDFLSLLHEPDSKHYSFWDSFRENAKLFITSATEKTILTDDQKNLLEEKEHELKTLLLKCESMKEDRPLHLHRHLELAKEHLTKNLKLPCFYFETDSKTIRESLFNERVRSLLHAQVELAYFANAEIDPVIGWLEYLIKENSFEVCNPFMSLSMNTNTYGAITKIEYFPRKILLNDGFNSLYYSISDSSIPKEQKKNPKPSQNYRIMRKQPDLFAIRFDEPLSHLNDTEPVCCKIIYFKSGLGSFMPNSTTGFSLEYWLENAETLPDTSDIRLHFPLIFPGDAQSIHLRALISAGGEDDRLYPLSEQTTNIHSSEVAGSLYGIRLIHSITHFIIDLRFAHQLNSLSFAKKEERSENTHIDLSFSQKAASIKDYDRLQSMYFCIY